jgi:hypothetical protein
MGRHCECRLCREARRDEWRTFEERYGDTPAAFIGTFLIVLAFVIWFIFVVQL